MSEVDTQTAEPAADAGEPAAETSEAETKEHSEANAETETGQDTTPDKGTTEDDNAEAKDDDEGDDKPKRRPRHERYKSQIERLQRENAELRSRNAGSLDPATLADRIEREIGKAPKEEDFKGDYLAFERALTVYEVDKRAVEREIRREARSAETAREVARSDAIEAHLDRVAEFRDKVSDFDDTIRAIQTRGVKVTPTVEALITESPKSAHLAYHLAKNPDRIDRLNAMSEREAAREIGRIEARLSLPAPKKQTAAPKPVDPPKGGAAPSSQDRELDAYLERTYGKQR